MKKSTKIALFALCVFSSFLQGWITLKVYAVGVWFLYFGIVGAIPFLLFNGVHGDAEGAAGFFGGILYILTNGAVYYWIVCLFLKLWRWRMERARLKSADLSASKSV